MSNKTIKSLQVIGIVLDIVVAVVILKDIMKKKEAKKKHSRLEKINKDYLDLKKKLAAVRGK